MILKFPYTIHQLKKEFPEIFAAEDGEKKLYFAVRLVLHSHSIRRYRNKKQNRKQISQRPEPRTTRSQKSNEQDQISESNQRSVVCDQTLLSCFVIDIRLWKKLGSESKLLVVQMPQQSISQILSQSKELRAECDSLENNPGISRSVSQTLPWSNKCAITDARPEVTPSNYTVYDPKQYHAIHGFLQASMPPTTHLMDAFINFGCINADFLLAISSWPSEKIRGVLDQLPPGPDGKQITEMDKFILQYHFKEYYAQLWIWKEKSLKVCTVQNCNCMTTRGFTYYALVLVPFDWMVTFCANMYLIVKQSMYKLIYQNSDWLYFEFFILVSGNFIFNASFPFSVVP